MGLTDLKEAGAFWVGKTEPGTDDEHFNTPEGLATDAKGNLYVCDWGNNRVVVFGTDGKLLGKFAAEKPQQIAVHPASGEIFVLSPIPSSLIFTFPPTASIQPNFLPSILTSMLPISKDSVPSGKRKALFFVPDATLS